jgi:alcohol dehydrogenase class IV
MLAAVMRWNEPANRDRQRLISEAMGGASQSAGAVIEQLIVSLGLPHRLRDVASPKLSSLHWLKGRCRIVG